MIWEMGGGGQVGGGGGCRFDQIIVLTLRTQTDRPGHRLIRICTVFHSPSNFTRIYKK